MKDLRRRLIEEPCAYILFPEGGRSRDGRLKPFKSGLGMLVAGTDVPVIPCHIEGAFAALRPGHFVPAPVPIRLRIGAPIRFVDVPNDRDGWNIVAQSVRAAIEMLGAGSVPGEYTATDCKQH
jgi:1-acyl-sn-glycerol-3-phosphate acyltransferase